MQQTPEQAIAHELGARALAPLLAGFSAWLRDEIARGRPHLVLFLTREGAIMRRAFLHSAPPAGADITRLAHASRRVLRAATLFDRDDVAGELNAPFADCTLAELFEHRFDVDLPALPSAPWRDAGFPTPSTRVNRRQHLPQLMQLAMAVADPVLARSRALRDNMLPYYRALGVADGTRVMVVDIGYNGTCLRALQTLFPRAEFTGRFLITFAGAGTAGPGEESCRGWLFHEADRKRSPHPVLSAVTVLEFLLMSEEGTTLGFDARHHPVLGTPLPAPALRLIGDIQEAALARIAAGVPPLSVEAIRRHWKSLLGSPALAIARHFQGLAIDDAFGGKPTRYLIAPFPPGTRSLREEEQLIAASSWKAGALRLLGAQRTRLQRVSRSPLARELRRGFARRLKHLRARMHRAPGNLPDFDQPTQKQ